MSKPSQVIVVIEDERHEMLVRRYLKRCRIGFWGMRIESAPPGEGSAEAWVRTRFVKEVSKYRNRQTRAETALLLLIDADSQTLQQRKRQLDQALRDAESANR